MNSHLVLEVSWYCRSTNETRFWCLFNDLIKAKGEEERFEQFFHLVGSQVNRNVSVCDINDQLGQACWKNNNEIIVRLFVKNIFDNAEVREFVNVF